MRLDAVGGSFSSDVQTDWKTLDLMALADALRGLHDHERAWRASVPGLRVHER